MSETKKFGKVTPAAGEITIELSSKPSFQLWVGKKGSEGKVGIFSMPGFFKVMKDMENAIKADDPYADYFFYMIEQSIENLKAELQVEMASIEELLNTGIPAGMNIPTSTNKTPNIIAIKLASKIGFFMVYELLKIDQIVLKVIMANHIGLINNSEKSDIVFRLQNKFRSVMYEAFNFKFTGVTRDDIAANNQVARRAISLMGDLDKEFLEGTTRSNNAPYLPVKRLKVASNSKPQPANQDRDDGVKTNAKKNNKPQQKAKQPAKKPIAPRKPEISSNLLDQAIDELVSEGIKSN